MAPPPLPPPPPPISFSNNSKGRNNERDRTTVTVTTARARGDEFSNDHSVNEESRPRSTTNSSTINGISMSLPPLPPPSSLVERNKTLSQTQSQPPSESDTTAKKEENTTVIMSSTNGVPSSGPIIPETMATSMAPQHNSLVAEKTSLQDAEATRSDKDNNTNDDDLMPNAITVAPPITMPFDNVIPQCLESVEELRSYIMRNPLEHESMEQLMQQKGIGSEGEAKLWVLQTIQKRMDEIFHFCWTLIHPSYYKIGDGDGGGDNPNNDNLSKEDVEVRLAMSNQIMGKAKQAVLLCSMYVTGHDGSTSLPSLPHLVPSHDDIIDDGRNNGPPYPIQAAVAPLMECALAIMRFHLSGEHTTSMQQPPPNHAANVDDETNFIIQCYVHYQTQTLNERSKPAVANLVSLRNVVMKQQQTANTFGELLIQYAMEESSNHPEDADDDHDGDDNELAAAQQRRQQKVQPHMFAITTIINEATSLIHPLACWYDALSPPPPPEHNGGRQPHETRGLDLLCLRSIQALDQIVSSLVEKLGKWFLIDREIATIWMEHYGILSNKKTKKKGASFYNLQQHQQEEILDSIILEELAYLCQLLSRYSKFIEPYLDIAKDTLSNKDSTNHATGGESTTSSAIVDSTHPLQLMVQEFIGYYSTLEDSLFSRKLSRAMDIATVPAEIYDGIYVSTLVEDAYYLSKRTLERVVSTGNDQAMITLTNRICESWGASGASSHHNNGIGGNEHNDDNDILGMYHAIECGIGCDFSALIKQQEEIQRQKELSKQKANAPSSGSDAFASAFLEALDDDIMTSAGESTSSSTTTNHGKTSSTPSRKRVVRTPPTSGNLLSLASFVSTTTTTLEEDVLWQLKSHLCVLNSIASASSACSAIAALYSDVIEGRLLLDSDEEGDVVLNNNNNNNDDDDIQVNNNHTFVPRQQQDPTTKMLEFTRDEWKTHSRSYKSMLDQKVNEELDHWVGVALVPSHPDLIPPSSSSSSTSTKPISSSGIHWLKGVGVGLGGSSTSSSSSAMDSTTSTTQDDNKEATMRARHPKPIVQIQMTFCYQNYNISSELYHTYESSLVLKLLTPLRRCLLIQNIGACESHVKLEIIGTLAKRITNHIILPMMLEGIGHGSTAQLKQFTDWGALLLSKQVRLLQTELCSYLNNDKLAGVERHSDEGTATAAAADPATPMINTAPILQAFEKVFQAITILQLEKPSDWLVMRYSSSVGGRSDDGPEPPNLTISEIKHIMLLRVGFSPEAVAKVCQTLLQSQ